MVIVNLESLETISEKLRKARISLGISQKALAKLAGVSQGEIARMERRPAELNPSYVTLFSVITAINNYNSMNSKEATSKLAYELMHKKIVYVRPEEKVKKALELMHNNDFSMLPVLDSKHRCIGSLNQKKLLELALEMGKKVDETAVKEVMEGPLPLIDKNTPLSKIKPILENWDAILITNKTQAVGIITIYDLFKIII